MKHKLFALSLCTGLGLAGAHAQSAETDDRRHEIRLAGSDGSTLASIDILGVSIAPTPSDGRRTDEKCSGVFGLGYRYDLGRFRVGADIGFASVTATVVATDAEKTARRETELNFLILPTAELVYFKKGCIELYSSAALGVDISRTDGKTAGGEGATAAHRKTDLASEIAFQINPIAVRVGNDCVAGFVEAGFGYKGFGTAGVSLRF